MIPVSVNAAPSSSPERQGKEKVVGVAVDVVRDDAASLSCWKNVFDRIPFLAGWGLSSRPAARSVMTRFPECMDSKINIG
jgi:hypothetical protein